MAITVKDLVLAAVLTTLFVHGRAEELRIPLGEKGLLESGRQLLLFSLNKSPAESSLNCSAPVCTC